MANDSSGEDLVAKSRKPYTISKQRERWTEEEHGRFLKALKLYGRAWQRIEEHIGTKTAVQIRSHAQKFFLKLEKDASDNGALISQVLDIDIPPPRPKKKPSNPYPRKTNSLASTAPVDGKDGKISTLDSSRVSQKGSFKGIGEQENLETPCPSMSLAHSCTRSCEKPMPTSMFGSHSIPQNNESASSLKMANGPNLRPDKAATEKETIIKGSSEIGDLKISQPIPGQVIKYMDSKHDNFQVYNQTSAEVTQSDGQSACPPMYHQLTEQRGRVTNQFRDPDSSTPREHRTTEIATPYPPTPSLFHADEDGYRSYLQFASAFSNMVVSTLQQTPIAYAAASLAAAAFQPNFTMEAPAEHCGGFPSKSSDAGGASPSIAALTAATVAAATAWWASNGLIPFCHPQQSLTHNQSCFTMNIPGPSHAVARSRNVTNERSHQDRSVKQDQQGEVVDSPTFPGRNSAFKPIRKSEVSQILPLDRQPAAIITNDESAAIGVGIQGSNSPLEDRKNLNRSSSGSNTTSSTELETDVLEKCDRGDEEANGPDDLQSAGDSSNRRPRITANTNDSWKEVSEEGRVAFQALFSRQVLPQKFPTSLDASNSDTHCNNDQDTELKLGEFSSPVDRSSNIYESCSTDQEAKTSGETNTECKGNEAQYSLTIGKLGTHKTGFKPYKRSSFEANDINVPSSCSQAKEKRFKSECLEGGEASVQS